MVHPLTEPQGMEEKPTHFVNSSESDDLKCSTSNKTINGRIM